MHVQSFCEKHPQRKSCTQKIVLESKLEGQKMALWNNKQALCLLKPSPACHFTNRGSYMTAHVLLNLLNKLGKK